MALISNLFKLVDYKVSLPFTRSFSTIGSKIGLVLAAAKNAVALFPVLESAWSDADECGESGLAENL